MACLASSASAGRWLGASLRSSSQRLNGQHFALLRASKDNLCPAVARCNRRAFCAVASLAADAPEDASRASKVPASPSSDLVRLSKPTIHDPPRVMKPGDFVDVATVIRNWWSFPAVGFNSILEMQIQKLECYPPDDPPPVGSVVVPNGIFGVPIRKDMVHKVYWYHRKALAGYCETMQLYKWEWPGSNKKVRSQKKSGKGRMGRRKAPGRFDGVFTHALRPRDWRGRMNKRSTWRALRVMLSVKFMQNSIKVVDSFNLQSHKTKHLVSHLRRLVGRKCKSAMLVHEGHVDVNDNFRWASAHIAAVHRENVEGVSVYNLLKYHQLIITETALMKLISEINSYPFKRDWGHRNATPDGKPAPHPEKVDGWNKAWIEKKERLRNAQFRSREFYYEQQKWKWSHELKGPLKVARHDPLENFRVKDFMLEPEKPIWEKLESLYVDDEPLEEDPEEDEFEDLIGTLEDSQQLGSAQRTELIDAPGEIEQKGLAALATSGRRSARARAVGDEDDARKAD